MATPSGVAALIGRIKAAGRDVYIPHDPSEARELRDAERHRDQLRARLDSGLVPDQARAEVETQAKEAAGKVESLQGELRSRSVHFVARSVGRETFQALVDRFPPTPEQRKEQPMSPPRWNRDTFPPYLLAACLEVDDGASMIPLDEDSALALWNDQPSGVSAPLLQAALEVNQEFLDVDLGKGSSLTLP